MALTKAQLLTLVGVNLPDNELQLITPELHREVVNEVIDACYPEATEALATIPPYEAGVEYQPGPQVYVIYNSVIWQFISPTPQTGVEPGTNALVWQNVSLNDLAHPQNTDYRIGEYLEIIDTIPDPFAIFDYPGKNFFLLAADDVADLNIETTTTEISGLDTLFLESHPYEFYIAVAAGDTGTYSIKDSGQFMTPTGADVVLEEGDWVKCKLIRDNTVSAINRPVGRAQIIAAGPGVTGMGTGTGHDQNTDVGTDKDTWYIGAASTAGTTRTLQARGAGANIDLLLEAKGTGVLKSSALATGVGPVEADADGVLSKGTSINISDSPLQSIILVSPDTTQWRVTVSNAGALVVTEIV
jgi:hypothetical protein